MTADKESETHDFFFYGTLCHPTILMRVLGHKCEHLLYQDAILPNYARHKVKNEDYPAVIDIHDTYKIIPPSSVLFPEEVNTRGTFVRGMSYADMHTLDLFEGSQYSRIRLPIQTLTPPAQVHRLPKTLDNPKLRKPLDNIEAERSARVMRRAQRAAGGSTARSRSRTPDAAPPGERRSRRYTSDDEEEDDKDDKDMLKAALMNSGVEAEGGESEVVTRVVSPEGDVHVDEVVKSLERMVEKEGDEPLNEIPGTTNTSPEVDKDSLQEEEVQVGLTEGWVYVWKDDLDLLEKNVWKFEEFLKDKGHIWLNMDYHEYTDLERAKALEQVPQGKGDKASTAKSLEDDGDESMIKGKTMEGYEDFGHNMLKYWNFREGLVNLNHGSYGSPPKPVIEAMRKFSDETENFPDLFMRRTYQPILEKVRTQVSEMINCSSEEVVIVPNATHGINTIVNNLNWQDGDIIIIYATTYGAVGQTMKYICDRHPSVRLEIIQEEYPCPQEEIVRKTTELISKYNKPAVPDYSGQPRPTGVNTTERVRLVVVDQIASNPGVRIPWKEIVNVCKKYGVLSLVDAAHAIGQETTDLRAADPDFWISNCHKWLMSHRGSAIMYVPMRNQHLVISSFPTSAGYESSRYPSELKRTWSFIKQYEWTGTQDWCPFLSISSAIEFRKSIGGEDRIMEYCNSLAMEGGKRLRKRWGTVLMDNPEMDLTAAMVNVQLPKISFAMDIEERFKQLRYLEDRLFEENCFAACYPHAGKWWARFSAQVWVELSDFDYIGDVLEKICEEVQRGKHLNIGEGVSQEMHEAADLEHHNE